MAGYTRIPHWVPDYSTFHVGCDYCGRILSEVREQPGPLPCPRCNMTNYCSRVCLVSHYKRGHRSQCFANMDHQVEMHSAETTTRAQALRDLRMYTARWHDQLGDAALAAMNLAEDPTAMNRQALVVHLSYVTRQPYRMRRFRFEYAKVDRLETFVGTTMNGALLRREQNSHINLQNGMMGCALIVLACNVPGVGFVFNSTFVGPEPSVLMEPPPPGWQERLSAALNNNTLS